MKTSTGGKPLLGSWRDWTRRLISLSLLIGLVWYVGSFYSRERLRWWVCDYRCQPEEVPHRLLREFLNGERESIFLRPGSFLHEEIDYEENPPVENPAPDDWHHYYAALDFAWNERDVAPEIWDS